MKQDHHSDPARKTYPLGRGYGHDYMRGGEVFGGYGYSEREEYTLPRGVLNPEKARDTEVPSAPETIDSN